tara:strand:- start:48649 stop:49137 length:489 start_codon:yes stop_codon:yes gene_type:complete
VNKGLISAAAFFVFALLLCAVLYVSFPASHSQDLVSFEQGALSIHKADGLVVDFDIEIASRPEQLSQGLMYRQNMPTDSGMLFLYPYESRVAFWMKNTLIPLDMIFAGRDGVIRSIHRGAKPMDESRIAPSHLVFMVLEVNAGVVDAHGIQAGDKIIYDMGD